MLSPGTVLQNRYLIVRLIAQGGMGAVYLARDQRLDSEVALKETLFTDERMSRAFEREARLLARLRHPALPRVSDHFTDETGQFLIMEYIPGEDLAETLKSRAAPIPSDEVIRWADQLLDALDYLHSQEPPVVHRDIKPQNLKLTDRGQIILLDFGLAKGMHLQLTKEPSSGSIHGFTPTYAPLEQIQGVGTDPRSDLYSLAATIYHFVTGAPPQDALTRAAAVVEGEPDPLRDASEVNRQISPSVAAVMHRALALSRNNRHASAAEMRRAIRAACESVNIVGDQETAVMGAPREVVILLRQEKEQLPPPVPVEAQSQKSEDEGAVLRDEAAPHPDVPDLVSAGASAFDVGQYALAVEHWEAALRLSPDEPGIKESINNARKAIRKEEGRKAQVQRLVAEGTEAFDDRRYEMAIEKWNQARAISPNEPGVEASLKTARMAIEKGKERQGKVKQLVSLGASAFDRGEYELAINRWNEALSLSPQEAGIKQSIESASQRQEIFEKAQQDRQRQTAQQSAKKGQTFAEEPLITYQVILRIAIGTVLLVVILIYVLFVVIPTTAPTASEDANPQPQVPAVANRQPQAPAASVSPAVPSGSRLILNVEAATGDSWVRYQVDDSKLTTLVLRRGQSQDLPPARDKITLSYGNRLTLRLKINGREAYFPPDTPEFNSQVVISRENFQTFFR